MALMKFEIELSEQDARYFAETWSVTSVPLLGRIANQLGAQLKKEPMLLKIGDRIRWKKPDRLYVVTYYDFGNVLTCDATLVRITSPEAGEGGMRIPKMGGGYVLEDPDDEYERA